MSEWGLKFRRRLGCSRLVNTTLQLDARVKFIVQVVCGDMNDLTANSTGFEFRRNIKILAITVYSR